MAAECLLGNYDWEMKRSYFLYRDRLTQAEKSATSTDKYHYSQHLPTDNGPLCISRK